MKEIQTSIAKRNVNGALKVLTNNMSGGILPLPDETLQLELKHHDAKDTSQQVQRPIQKMHPIMYDDTDKELIKKQ